MILRSLLLFIWLYSSTAFAFTCPESTTLQGSPYPKGEELYCINSDGEKHGAYKRWYSNGQLMQYMHYQAGNEHGKQQSWWPNGQLMMEGISINGVRYKGFKYWSTNGEAIALEFKTD